MKLGNMLANDCGSPTSLTQETINIYKEISERGWGDKDFSIAYKYFKELKQ